MPICSYLVHAARSDRAELVRVLNRTEGCEAIASDGGEVIILVTDTPDAAADEKLREMLELLPAIQCLTLTFGEIEAVAKESTDAEQ